MGSGVFSAGFVLGMEIVAPKNRVTAGNMISIFFTLGLVVMGLISMSTDNWRTLLQISYAPGILVIIHFWAIPESVRWLIAKGKKKEASKIILRAARVNKVQLSDECLEMLHVNMPIRKDNDEQMNQLISNAIPEETKKEETFWDVIKNKALLIRLANFAFCYLANNFIYYGLSLSSVALAGNKNFNFILAALIEIPAYITTYFLMNKFGRKKSLCCTLILSGAACVSAELVPGEFHFYQIYFLNFIETINLIFNTLNQKIILSHLAQRFLKIKNKECIAIYICSNAVNTSHCIFIFKPLYVTLTLCDTV